MVRGRESDFVDRISGAHHRGHGVHARVHARRHAHPRVRHHAGRHAPHHHPRVHPPHHAWVHPRHHPLPERDGEGTCAKQGM